MKSVTKTTTLIELNGISIAATNGSKFPSHQWYVNRTAVGTLLQAHLGLSESEEALSKGNPSTKPHMKAIADKSTGKISLHPFTVSASRTKQISLNV